MPKQEGQIIRTNHSTELKILIEKNSSYAFARTVIDYNGPYVTIQGRVKYWQKRYLCFFTCLTIRAVHLEIAFAMDTNKFLNALYRMVNCSGLPIEMISDNANNFIGTEREPGELKGAISKTEIKESTVNKGINWIERAISTVLGNSDIVDKELITAFTGAGTIIDSRLLTYQTENPDDDVQITPAWKNWQRVCTCIIEERDKREPCGQALLKKRFLKKSNFHGVVYLLVSILWHPLDFIFVTKFPDS